MEKLHSYQGWSGRVHEIRDNFKAKFSSWRENHEGENIVDLSNDYARKISTGRSESGKDDFSHIYRRKTRSELIRLSASVMGIEFAYASETAFVSPTLLKIGVQHQHMTLVWALSPIVGFFLTPILGSLSDRCNHPMGRRRPFIILLSIGVFFGLLLVPNGEDLGYYMGDYYEFFNESVGNLTKILPHRTTAIDSDEGLSEMLTVESSSHSWGIFFTILGTVLLDFDADACQSPARAYLLDVTQAEDHARGLSTFTIMAGLGGALGYSLGGINWDVTKIGIMLGGHVRAVFTLITFIFIFCVGATITSFREIPLALLDSFSQIDDENVANYGTMDENEDDEKKKEIDEKKKSLSLNLGKVNEGYATLPGENIAETSFTSKSKSAAVNEFQNEAAPSLKHYLLSIIHMPKSIQTVCVTNFFCWSAHVCYSLYFTDFVGESVFGGDPKAPYNSPKYNAYEEGVRFGCFGMAMYSLSCACYSLIIEKLIWRFRAKKVYIGGLLFYSASMTLMALTKHKIGVIVFSWGAGVMYSTLFTMPYLLIAHYHAQGVLKRTPLTLLKIFISPTEVNKNL